ncbi:iron-siderophore ABC transporter substrate-binding protein [Chlorogloeopsis sp. ULAP01]|uniref:iron-siderophore ABC transporter substrate-binding protein n=1 Tax=Chlorogloeopsis sp. ULAP01 TaxID=3056483 RepID=UPI0025AAA13A|nr:iron-siderophore ABC transporter substrate-binding protein [Chlorogloeopsis sp. ULAP01]MDM9380813.1 iron-siderophore ABC transporter substrate-binding protein [Chlorogloeopsis sp. ULAP01]
MRLTIKRSISLLLLAAFTTLLVTACNPTSNLSIKRYDKSIKYCRVVQDVMGNTCIPNNPQRIVTMMSISLGSAWALGIKPIASAWVPGEPFPAYIKDQEQLENIGTLYEPNVEKILQLKPDLIVSNTRPALKRIHKQLSSIAPTVVVDAPIPPLSWQQSLEDIANLFGKEQESQRLIELYWQRVEKLRQALGDKRYQLKVSVITINPPYGIFTYGQKHPTSQVLSDVGLQRPLIQMGDFTTKEQISQELLPELDGDVIFLSYRGKKAAKESLEKLQQTPLWRTLKAVQQNRVYLVDANHWYAFDVLAMNAVIDDLFKYLVNAP